MTYSMESVTVRYGHTTALHEVSLTIPVGQVTAVVGGDGAGKSTLLGALVGERPLSTGTVRAPDPQQIGYLPATAGSWLDLTVAENMQFVGGAYGLHGQDLAARSDRLLERAGLLAARDRLSRNLSGGMRRKLGFCLAMLHNPPLLVLDEPSTGVDPVSRVDLWRLISEAAAAGAAVLMSTTYLDEAARAASLLVLDRGRAILAGTPAEVVGSLRGVIVETSRPERPDWAWRRGRVFHEFRPSGADGSDGDQVAADLEDVVIATSLQHRRDSGRAS